MIILCSLCYGFLEGRGQLPSSRKIDVVATEENAHPKNNFSLDGSL
jgi:hypothetical protein